MPETFRYQSTVTIDGVSFTDSQSDDAISIERASPSVPVAKVGELTTRTDNDTGVVTFAGGHGFVNGNKVDIFWSGGQRRKMDATVAVNAVTLDGGEGDNLPVVNTDVTGMVPTVVDFNIDDGDDVLALGVSSTAQGWVVFVDDGGNDIADATYRLDAAGGKNWAAASGMDNPLSGDVVASVKFSHASSGAAQVMKASAVFGAA